jgi:triosephosphate isomerase (TIM)
MRRKLVVGNWKMHGGLAKNQALMTALKQQLQGLTAADFAVCVPYPYLFQAQALLAGSNILWGAQNVSQFDEGAFTASISAQMIADFGCAFAIIGHSERRAVSHESNQSAKKRFMQAIAAGITPIFCVGETLAERQAGMAESIVRTQMQAVLDGLEPEMFALAKQMHMVIAYEPVWAIGASQTASPQEAQAMHQLIRSLIADKDAAFASCARIIYGGSVTPANAEAILSMPDIDGGLIGRSSLVPADFKKICEIACRYQPNLVSVV